MPNRRMRSTSPRAGVAALSVTLVIAATPACVTSHLIASTKNRSEPLVHVDGCDAAGAVAVTGLILGATVALDIATFPIQYPLSVYPYGRRCKPKADTGGSWLWSPRASSEDLDWSTASEYWNGRWGGRSCADLR